MCLRSNILDEKIEHRLSICGVHEIDNMCSIFSTYDYNVSNTIVFLDVIMFEFNVLYIGSKLVVRNKIS